jgi:hypothetical protein
VLAPVRLEELVCCLRCSTIAGPLGAGLTAGFAGAGASVALEVVPSAGAVTSGAGAWVVDVLGGAGAAGVGVEVLVVSGAVVSVVVVVGSSAGVVLTVLPSPVPALSAPRAAAGPSPATVMLPPASAETSARRIRRRERAEGVMRRTWSSFGRCILVVGAPCPQTRAPARIQYRQASTNA